MSILEIYYCVEEKNIITVKSFNCKLQKLQLRILQFQNIEFIPIFIAIFKSMCVIKS